MRLLLDVNVWVALFDDRGIRNGGALVAFDHRVARGAVHGAAPEHLCLL